VSTEYPNVYDIVADAQAETKQLQRKVHDLALHYALIWADASPAIRLVLGAVVADLKEILEGEESAHPI
jgi:hypothetical protein